MQIIADTHCHTLASDHAYSTVMELAQAARERGLAAIAMTDHGPSMPDAPCAWHFGNIWSLPRRIHDVIVLKGAEANIMDFDGTLDIEPRVLEHTLDWVVASFHGPCCAPGTIEDHTRAYLALADNPWVDVIGHSGTEDYKYDYERVIPVFGEKGKIVEINSHSFAVRAGAPENCRQIALLCKKYRVPVAVNSDAHFALEVGELSTALTMLREIDFPEELIINASLKRLAAYIKEKRGRDILA